MTSSSYLINSVWIALFVTLGQSESNTNTDRPCRVDVFPGQRFADGSVGAVRFNLTGRCAANSYTVKVVKDSELQDNASRGPLCLFFLPPHGGEAGTEECGCAVVQQDPPVLECFFKKLMNRTDSTQWSLRFKGSPAVPPQTLMVEVIYPPADKPVIRPDPTSHELLSAGTTLTCTVMGGNPPVQGVHFSCSPPDLSDQPDSVQGANVSSSLTISEPLLPSEGGHDRQLTEVTPMVCRCSATWGPEPERYRLATHASFDLERSRPPSTSDSEIFTGPVVTSLLAAGVVVVVIVIVIIIVVAISKIRKASHARVSNPSAHNQPEGPPSDTGTDQSQLQLQPLIPPPIAKARKSERYPAFAGIGMPSASSATNDYCNDFSETSMYVNLPAHSQLQKTPQQCPEAGSTADKLSEGDGDEHATSDLHETGDDLHETGDDLHVAGGDLERKSLERIVSDSYSRLTRPAEAEDNIHCAAVYSNLTLEAEEPVYMNA